MKPHGNDPTISEIRTKCYNILLKMSLTSEWGKLFFSNAFPLLVVRYLSGFPEKCAIYRNIYFGGNAINKPV